MRNSTYCGSAIMIYGNAMRRQSENDVFKNRQLFWPKSRFFANGCDYYTYCVKINPCGTRTTKSCYNNARKG